MPREEDEFELSYYNSMTTWIDLDRLLGRRSACTRERSGRPATRSHAAVRRAGCRGMPTYITLKDVKKRWGHGQEDVFPVAQFEKLWGDMTALPEVDCRFVVVRALRGQQLKDQAQLDGWLRDGSAAYDSRAVRVGMTLPITGQPAGRSASPCRIRCNVFSSPSTRLPSGSISTTVPSPGMPNRSHEMNVLSSTIGNSILRPSQTFATTGTIAASRSSIDLSSPV